ncbi:C40 family peptidase [Mucilaginibacter agri]|uniref:NlpC/P60 family protein n=1 Tax=Mucilaginibacter agri TaxID=2695265 RepID=A0A966DSJ9_9SPHI|nr:C40 family peptidase [Mucilaginibacter agri]NCD70223.1 NlpC/P60 family protein [Mucilaginibacter agri]
MRFNTSCFVFMLGMYACSTPNDKPSSEDVGTKDVANAVYNHPINPLKPGTANAPINIVTGATQPAELVSFARTLAGIPYKYGSTDPQYGFDCSGFISYVFNHFGISVPRSSVDFTYVNHQIDVKDAQAGDLILFTGTDTTDRTVGHMGIIISPKGDAPRFIHSTSGKAYGVTETSLYPAYRSRFVKVLRIFPQNDK